MLVTLGACVSFPGDLAPLQRDDAAEVLCTRLARRENCSDGGSEPRGTMAFLKTSAGVGVLQKNNSYHLLSAEHLSAVDLTWI